MKNDKMVFLVDTPLQLLNSISFIISNKLQKQADLFIADQFKNASSIISNVKKENLFNNIYILHREKKGFFKHLYTIIGLIAPDIYCKMLLGVEVKKKKYEILYFSAPTKMFDFIIAASKAKHVYGIEDGIGSYSGDIFHDYLSKKYLTCRKIFGNDYKVERLYIREPQNYIGPNSDIVYPMFKDDDFALDEINGIFNYKKSELYNRSIIYVNQPINDFAKEHVKYEGEIINAITSEMNSKLLVRLHPREVDTGVYSNCEIDTEGNMWELLCSECITPNTCIIGMLSTSQFVPKFFYDIEPLVVFTFKLYSDLDDATVEKYEKQANHLKELYRNKHNVRIVNSLEEIKTIIKLTM